MATTGVEGQWQAPIAATANAPVTHVVQPVLHMLADEVGLPVDGRCHLLKPCSDGISKDEPLTAKSKDKRLMATPTVWVTVYVWHFFDKNAGLLHEFNHKGVYFLPVHALELFAAFFRENTIGVGRNKSS